LSLARGKKNPPPPHHTPPPPPHTSLNVSKGGKKEDRNVLSKRGRGGAGSPGSACTPAHEAVRRDSPQRRHCCQSKRAIRRIEEKKKCRSVISTKKKKSRSFKKAEFREVSAEQARRANRSHPRERSATAVIPRGQKKNQHRLAFSRRKERGAT